MDYILLKFTLLPAKAQANQSHCCSRLWMYKMFNIWHSFLKIPACCYLQHEPPTRALSVRHFHTLQRPYLFPLIAICFYLTHFYEAHNLRDSQCSASGFQQNVRQKSVQNSTTNKRYHPPPFPPTNLLLD